MTSTMNPMNPLLVPTPAAPSIGQLVPLGRCVIKLDVSAQTTMPDTPNGYTAAMKVMADQGDLDTTALEGEQGPPGQVGFQVRETIDATINSVADLKPLPNNPEYIGRYYVLKQLDSQGQVVGQTAYVWYGSSYRAIMMGAFGPPGPVPKITPEVELIPPTDADGKPNQSYVQTFGPRLRPTWLFNVAAPAGPVGLVSPMATFPDVDEKTVPPVVGDLLMFTGKYTADGNMIWAPGGLGGQLPTTWSMPESAFTAFTGIIPPNANGVAIGSFSVPPQPFPWTPIVWGHIGETGGSLSTDPFMLGCQVLLGDPTRGIQIARGMGTTLGCVNIFPHYSSSANNQNNRNKSLAPNNGYAVVPANHGNPAMGTVYINLWNDGQAGAVQFQPKGAQLFLMLQPMGPIYKPQQASAYAAFSGQGSLSGLVQRVIP
jgi:hypothetical protein